MIRVDWLINWLLEVQLTITIISGLIMIRASHKVFIPYKKRQENQGHNSWLGHLTWFSFHTKQRQEKQGLNSWLGHLSRFSFHTKKRQEKQGLNSWLGHLARFSFHLKRDKKSRAVTHDQSLPLDARPWLITTVIWSSFDGALSHFLTGPWFMVRSSFDRAVIYIEVFLWQGCDSW